jgi:hypothetical protein
MNFKRRTINTIKPVRAIKRAAFGRGGDIAIRNAVHACGYSLRRVRHTSAENLLGDLPKPVLEAVLRRVLAY